MPKVNLIATRNMMYNTRHLVAGQRFQARAVDAVVLTELRKSARYDYEAAVKEPLPQPEQPQQVSDQVAAALTLGQLRAEAETLGIRLDRRWAEGRLRQEIDRARSGVTTTAAEPAPSPAEPERAPEPVPEPPLGGLTGEQHEEQPAPAPEPQPEPEPEPQPFPSEVEEQAAPRSLGMIQTTGNFGTEPQR